MVEDSGYCGCGREIWSMSDETNMVMTGAVKG